MSRDQVALKSPLFLVRTIGIYAIFNEPFRDLVYQMVPELS